LYAGKLDLAIDSLGKSLAAQNDPSAEGDELCHLASALIEKGDLINAARKLELGLELIEKNNGSRIWLTYGLMTRATLLGNDQNILGAIEALIQALEIARKGNLKVRQEEIQYMLDHRDFQVLNAVGVRNISRTT